MKRSLTVTLAVLLLLTASLTVLSAFAEETTPTTTVSLNKSVYMVGEDILVTATGTGADWVGLYAEGDTYDPAAGGVVSIRWYYVARDGNQSGDTKRIQESDYTNSARGELLNIPAGRYKMVLMENDGYNVLDCVPFTVLEVPYVTEGLVAWYDGAQNTQNGHDEEATVWADLVGGHDLPVENTEANRFSEGGFDVTCGQFYFPQEIVDVVNGQEFTVELLFSEFVSTGTTFNTFLNSSNDNLALFRRNEIDSIEFKFAQNPRAERPTIPDALNLLQNALVTVTYKVGGETHIYINGEDMVSCSSPSEMGADDLYIGHADASKTFTTTYRSMRFYDRALTAEEIKQNAIADGVAEARTTYTVTFVAGGVQVAKVTFEAGATSVKEPEVPAREGYTGVWMDYEMKDCDFIVRALYTEISEETETETETEIETETETETETEPETDPVREPLDLSVEVDPYVPASPSYMTDVKAMWLSQFDLNAVYTSGGKQREENDFRTRIGDILQNVVDNGFNTVFLQVRPNADSFYPSEYYPPSKYVVGSYANDFTYDPFEIVIQEARARGLSIHAWINPLRGMSDAEIQQIDSSYAIRQWYDDGALCGTYLVKSGSLWYLNPAYAEVRDLIVYGAREILQRYDVDGIHMDDYFYPTQEASFDSTAYTAYKNSGGKLSLADWRRENLSDLVSRLYRVTKQQRADALFGISPAGTLNKVYANQYADVHRWCGEPGFVDYILPQVYFGFEHATMPFDGVCNQWRDIIKTDYVDLLIGVTFGKASSKYDQWAGAGKNEWAEHTDILARSIIYTLTLDKCRGMSVFCYQYFYDPVTGIPNASTAAEREGFIAILKEASWEE